MEWIREQNGLILFVAFFVLYGLEFVIPLVRKPTRHLASNAAAAVVLVAINLSFTSLTFLTSELTAEWNLGLFNSVAAPMWMVLVTSVIFLDFWAGYLVHYTFHRFSWLWKLHSVHHCDDLVDVTTTFRQHPAESIIRVLFHLSGVIILGIPLWILLVYLTLGTIHAQFEHANIQLPKRIDSWLQWIIVTPNMHKIHHSRYQHETDSNYSNILSVWDRLFRTFRARTDYSNIDYGLDYLEEGRHYSYMDLIRLPFEKIHPDGSDEQHAAQKEDEHKVTGKPENAA